MIQERARGARRNGRSTRVMVTLPNATFDRIADQAYEQGVDLSTKIASMIAQTMEAEGPC